MKDNEFSYWYVAVLVMWDVQVEMSRAELSREIWAEGLYIPSVSDFSIQGQ